jgi:hypothetical protein
MKGMTDEGPIPVERTELPPLDDLFQAFKNLASDDDMLLFARWYDSLLHAPSPAGGNRRHLFMAAYYLARQALVTDHGQSTGSGRVQ